MSWQALGNWAFCYTLLNYDRIKKMFGKCFWIAKEVILVINKIIMATLKKFVCENCGKTSLIDQLPPM